MKLSLFACVFFALGSACWFWLPLETVLAICKWLDQHLSIRTVEGCIFAGVALYWAALAFCEYMARRTERSPRRNR